MKKFFVASVFLLLSQLLYSQTDSVKTPVPRHTEIKGYVGIVHPIYTISKDGNAVNFKDYYVVGNPWGINFWKTKRFGLSLEFTPMIKTDKNTSKVTSVLFHPGVLYKIGHEFTVIGRLAYETTGRYGFTPIINKVLIRTDASTFFVALLFPVRFGNGHAPSYTTALQFGLGF